MNAAFERLLATGALVGIALAVATGPFLTALLPLPRRVAFWTALVAWNALKWWAWMRLVVPRVPWLRGLTGVGLGALLLNLPLPYEVGFAYQAVGIAGQPPFLPVFATALLISAAIAGLVAAATPPPRTAPPLPTPPLPAPAAAGPPPRATPPPGAPSPPAPTTSDAQPPEGEPRGIARRIAPQTVEALTAEDHYVRIHLVGGASRLELSRLSDAIEDFAGLDGERVHRGAWVAARAVAGAERRGRRWWLVTRSGLKLPVSERHLPRVRARGWLKAPGAPP
ncbi:MAG: LytTR family transcriptional regulator [Sphingomonadaceae bacterium]|uniref:LytTR family DNA-binding domain-containing protein n=1 Tax=Thermaurantiacus sp. TaxID=2820283 RepID=UPI00298ED685|nr:LytTR family DNA-binding domain-containing protein [Thermaurantiacus sp.]MCS6987673.1 LytTR family transcriptional regulator [Sphingomonadaceae bacterium]MDW8415274.1 LytTR family DNA-binding domain-containing protein [Thermaurantiacus sp.]